MASSTNPVAVNRDTLIELCRELVAEPGTSGNEGGVANIVKRAMLQQNFDEVAVDSWGNVTGLRRATNGTGTILFDAHTDTVGVGNPADWNFPAFELNEVDGILYGRGIADMKGSIAAMIVGVGAIPKEELSADIVVSCSVCEEAIEGVALGKVLEVQPADIVVIGEATGLEIATGQRGRGELLVEVFGKPAHSSTPHLGINAVKKMARVITALSAVETPSHPVLGDTVMEVTDVMSHPYPGMSVIPEYSAATFDRRLIVGETPESLLASLEPVLQTLRDDDPELNVRITVPTGDIPTYPGNPMTVSKFSEAWLLDDDEPVIAAGKQALEAAGLPPMTRTYDFCTNGSESAGRRGIPTLGFGPGSEEQAHRVDEWARTDDIVKAAQGYASMARHLGSAIRK